MRLTIDFEIDAPLELVWAILTDVPLVTPCIPATRLLETIDPRTFRAAVAVRVGPMTIDYVVRIEIDALDDRAKAAILRVRGRQLLGFGAVTAHVRSNLSTVDGRTRVHLETKANVGGLIAIVGRPVIEALVRRKLAEFGANVARLADEIALEVLDSQ